MSPEIVVVLIGAVVSLGGSWLVAHQTTMGREDSRLAAAWERISALEERIGVLESKRDADALTKRAMGDHIDLLEHHIWQQKPPSPPPRPAGV